MSWGCGIFRRTPGNFEKKICDDTDGAAVPSALGERGAPLRFGKTLGEGSQAGGAFFDAPGECFRAGAGSSFL